MNGHEVGFVGVGQMGGAIVERLARGGVKLHIYDRNDAVTRKFQALGAMIHDSAKTVGDAAAIVCACLPSPEVSREAAVGPQGVIHGGRVRFYVEMSTVGSVLITELTSALAERNIAVLDAPVSGGPVGARAGTLAIMVAGAPEVLAAATHILEIVSPRIFRIGDVPGSAQKMKLVNNLLAAANMASSFEALVLGARLGLSPSKIVEVVNQSSGKNTGMDPKFTDRIRDRSFVGTAHIGVLVKDIRLAVEELRVAGLPLETFAALSGMAALWQSAADWGMLDADVPALVKIVEQAAGSEVREPR